MYARTALLASLSALALFLAACGGGDGESEESPPAATTTATAEGQLGGVKRYLLDHTERLTAFTGDFQRSAERYYELAEDAGFDYAALWSGHRDEVAPLLRETKTLWIEGNPAYERMEGVVAGVAELSKYDVILDAGTSAEEDPASAVPFDLELPDGRTLEQPGNLFNLTEGALWGSRPELTARGVRADLDGDGAIEFGEVLPDANAFVAAARAFDRYAGELAASARSWRPQQADAFTALVVMVPTMSEYFGQWKQSRFVSGERATGDAFNVVSRLADIRDILSGLEVVYDNVQPKIAAGSEARSGQIGRELTALRSTVADLYRREQSGKRFTPEEAELLGRDAQERATAIAGQVSQAAAELGIRIEQ
jgi:hypothetical protein